MSSCLQNIVNIESTIWPPNTIFEKIWAPNFVELLLLRLRSVQDETEPSRRVLWRQTHGGDARDTVPWWHAWATPPVTSDQSLDIWTSLARLPTPDSEEIKKDLAQDMHRASGDFKGAQKRPNPSNEEEDSQIPLPSAKRDTPTPSFWLQETITTLFPPNAFDQPFSDSSVKLATHNLLFQLDQGYSESCKSQFYAQHDKLEQNSPGKRFFLHHPTPQASSKTKRDKEKTRGSAGRKPEAVVPVDRLKEQAAGSRAYLPRGCLCGCGGDAMHCHRPPSPFTSSKEVKAPDIASMLETRLDGAATNDEPSNRIWCGEEFDSRTSDRESLDPSIWAVNGDDRGNILKTSSRSLDADIYDMRTRTEDRVQASRKRWRSTSPPDTPIRSPDEIANTLLHGFTYGLKHAPHGVPLCASGEKAINGFANYGNNLVSSRHSFTRTPTSPPEANPSKTPDPTFPIGFFR